VRFAEVRGELDRTAVLLHGLLELTLAGERDAAEESVIGDGMYRAPATLDEAPLLFSRQFRRNLCGNGSRDL
jgi:hypothetical protein